MSVTPGRHRVTGLARMAALITAAVLASQACGDRKRLPTDPDGEPTDPTATFARVQTELFDVSCAFSGCHASAAPQAGMDLSPGAAYSNIVGVTSTQRNDLQRIAPFSPDASYMVKKLRADPDIIGSPMPLTGQLSGEQLQLLVDWVLRGAPDDQ